MKIQQAIETLVSGTSLSVNQSSSIMGDIMSGEATPAQFGAFVTALRLKGETADEIVGMAKVMREKSRRVDVGHLVADTCGTGGDSSGTFNISTAAAFVVAGTGIKVAKHGNRAMSGSSGSADVLESLGVKIDLGPEGVTKCIKETGIGFMFAQLFHPSMKFAASPRREIGIRTVFNILGPLTNPASATAQLLGVADPTIGEKIANVLGDLGCRHALVVHGEDGLDEITLSAKTQVWELKEGAVTQYKITPEDLGFNRVEKSDLKAVGPEESATIIRNVLQGSKGATREVVLANAGATLVAADKAESIVQGISIAARSIDNGSAIKVLEDFKTLSQKLN